MTFMQTEIQWGGIITNLLCAFVDPDLFTRELAFSIKIADIPTLGIFIFSFNAIISNIHECYNKSGVQHATTKPWQLWGGLFITSMSSCGWMLFFCIYRSEYCTVSFAMIADELTPSMEVLFLLGIGFQTSSYVLILEFWFGSDCSLAGHLHHRCSYVACRVVIQVFSVRNANHVAIMWVFSFPEGTPGDDSAQVCF